MTYKQYVTYSVEGVVAATAELVTTLGAAEMHAASFRQCILKAAVWTGWRENSGTGTVTEKSGVSSLNSIILLSCHNGHQY